MSILIKGMNMPENGNETIIRIQPNGTILDQYGHHLIAKAIFLESLISPRWIPVTERLPDAYEDVLLQFPNNQAVGFCDRDGCWGIYSGDGFYTEVADNEPKPTHWAKKLREPPKEKK